jgi:hypothetical protein
MGAWIGDHPRGFLILVGVVWLAVYGVGCWWFPFGNCWCCKGKGVHYRKDGKAFRDCKWVCKGRGRRRRFGRTVFEWFRKVVKNST